MAGPKPQLLLTFGLDPDHGMAASGAIGVQSSLVLFIFTIKVWPDPDIFVLCLGTWYQGDPGCHNFLSLGDLFFVLPLARANIPWFEESITLNASAFLPQDPTTLPWPLCSGITQGSTCPHEGSRPGCRVMRKL